MIEFLTLVLGVVAGARTIDVAAGPATAAVELRLDGAVVGLRSEPPWHFAVDLGDELAPHELLAVALDAGGRELGRARQWINLPRGHAEARLVLEPGDDGWPATVRLTWASLWSNRPEAVAVSFDGRPLTVLDPRRFELPAYDRKAIHVLTAELTFTPDHRAHAEASFGGAFGERVSTELTAAPVVAAGRGRRLRLSEVRDAFVGAAREPVAAVSVEATGADLVVVCDQASQAAVRATIAEVERRMRRSFHERPQHLLPLHRDDRIRLLWPQVVHGLGLRGPALDPELFAVSKGPEATGLLALLAQSSDPPPPRRIADAVAVAAVSAAAGGHPRAVVLIVDPAAPDRSEFSAAAVRRYLARLHVPLFVWTPAADPGPITAEWGEVSSVASWSDLQGAVRDLRAALDRQSIVWLDGSHLPQTIHLADGVDGLTIAGAEPGASPAGRR